MESMCMRRPSTIGSSAVGNGAHREAVQARDQQGHRGHAAALPAAVCSSRRPLRRGRARQLGLRAGEPRPFAWRVSQGCIPREQDQRRVSGSQTDCFASAADPPFRYSLHRRSCSGRLWARVGTNALRKRLRETPRRRWQLWRQRVRSRRF